MVKSVWLIKLQQWLHMHLKSPVFMCLVCQAEVFTLNYSALMMNSVLWVLMLFLKFFSSVASFFFPTSLVANSSPLFTLPQQLLHRSNSQYLVIHYYSTRTALTQFHSRNRPFAVLQHLCRYAPRSPSLRWDCQPLTLALYATLFAVLYLSCCPCLAATDFKVLCLSLPFDSSIRPAHGRVTSEAWRNRCLTRRRSCPQLQYFRCYVSD